MSGQKGSGRRIEEIRLRLEQWRQAFGGPGRPIPEELWMAAAAVARSEGVALTARELRLDRDRLARRAGLASDGGVDDESNGFVEIDAARLFTAGRTVLRFESGDGERLGIELGDAEGLDVVALAEAFWARRK